MTREARSGCVSLIPPRIKAVRPLWPPGCLNRKVGFLEAPDALEHLEMGLQMNLTSLLSAQHEREKKKVSSLVEDNAINFKISWNSGEPEEGEDILEWVSAIFPTHFLKVRNTPVSFTWWHPSPRICKPDIYMSASATNTTLIKIKIKLQYILSCGRHPLYRRVRA